MPRVQAAMPVIAQPPAPVVMTPEVPPVGQSLAASAQSAAASSSVSSATGKAAAPSPPSVDGVVLPGNGDGNSPNLEAELPEVPQP